MINIDRLMNNLNSIGNIGKGEEGITRLAFSEEYYLALNKLEKYASDLGFKTNIDKVGNLFIEYNPNNQKDFILIGSHLDTVRDGGLYDGALGIITGLEILETFKDKNDNLNHGLILVAFNAEEGSEMGGTFGSRTICSRNEYNEDLSNKVSNYDLNLDDLKDSEIDFSKIKCFFELHVEQGAVLESENLEIGIVDGIVGITRYDLTINGTSNHAGTTPMNLRDDPIRKLPEVIDYLYASSKKFKEPFVMTIGDIKVHPGMYNVIPNRATLLIETRDLDQKNIDKFFQNLKAHLDESKVNYNLEKNIEKPSVLLDKDLMNAIENSCKKLNLKYKIMSSGAGHDAKELSHLVKTAMIFVPSKNGISHSIDEFTSEKDIENGANLFYDVLKNLKI